MRCWICGDELFIDPRCYVHLGLTIPIWYLTMYLLGSTRSARDETQSRGWIPDVAMQPATVDHHFVHFCSIRLPKRELNVKRSIKHSWLSYLRTPAVILCLPTWPNQGRCFAVFQVILIIGFQDRIAQLIPRDCLYSHGISKFQVPINAFPSPFPPKPTASSLRPQFHPQL